jgi:hypothetical protein
MRVTITDWFPRGSYDQDEHSNTYVLLGWEWYRNGSWNSSYMDGTRLFYIYAGPILFNRQLVRFLIHF